jgi:hypothetical protein
MDMVFRLLATILAASLPLLAQGKAVQYLYTYVDSNGKRVVNNLPPAYVKDKGLTLIDVKTGSVGLAISSSQMSRVLRSPELIALIDKIAEEHDVDKWLVRAVVQAESAFYEKARSHAGALGLMQLIPSTAERFGVIDPFDPVQNITGGVKYLRWLIDHFESDYTKVIAAYNAGENAVKKYNGVPPFAETRAYVPKVTRFWQNKSVVPDPKASGSMELLNNGNGGFSVASSQTEPKQQAAARPTYSWEDEEGKTTISNTKHPPPNARNVKKLF